MEAEGSGGLSSLPERSRHPAHAQNKSARAEHAFQESAPPGDQPRSGICRRSWTHCHAALFSPDSNFSWEPFCFATSYCHFQFLQEAGLRATMIEFAHICEAQYESNSTGICKHGSDGRIGSAICPAPKRARLPLAFSTLGCPKWSWLQILDFAQQHGFAAIELRGMLGELNLPARPEFAADKIAQARRDVASRGLKIACVSSSSAMHDEDPDKRAQQLADAPKFY